MCMGWELGDSVGRVIVAVEVFQLAAVLSPQYKLDRCTDAEVEEVKSTLVKKAEESFQQPSTQSDQRDGKPPPSKGKEHNS